MRGSRRLAASAYDLLTRNPVLLPVGLFVLALTLRLVLVSSLKIEPKGDYRAYHTMAVNLLGGNGLVDVFNNLAYYNPGYPLFVLAPLYAILGADPQFAHYLHAVLGAASVVFLYFIALIILRHRGWAFLAGLMLATKAETIVYCAYLAKENFTVPVTLGAVLMALLAANSIRPVRAIFVSGLLAGIALLTGTSSVYVIPALVFLAWKAGKNEICFNRMRALMALVLGVALVVSPWVLRNQLALGAPVFSTSGGFNLYLGNNPNATGHFVSVGATPLAERWHEFRRSGEVFADRQMRDAAVRHIVSDPVSTIMLAVKKVVLLWRPPLHHLEGKGVTKSEYLLRLLWLTQYCVIFAGVLVALLVSVRRIGVPPEIWALWTMIAGFTLVHALMYVILRYRVPITPVLILLCCFGISEALRLRESRRPRESPRLR